VHTLVIPSWYGSTPGDTYGSFFRDQALALHRRGCRVGIIYPALRSPRRWRNIFGRFDFEETLDEGVVTLRKHGVQWLPRVPYLAAGLWVEAGLSLYRSYCKRFGRPDVIHAHGCLFAGLLTAQICERERIPFVISEHATRSSRGTVKPWHLQMARDAAARAAGLFAVSPGFAQQLQQLFGAGTGTWRVLPNAVSDAFLNEPLPNRHRARKYFEFISVALLTRKKGVHLLVEAFAEAFKGEPATRLTIVGDGPERPLLEGLSRAHGLAERIRFTGKLSRHDVVRYMAESDAFVLPSLVETFGVVVIEALALGKPVVVTRSGGPESFVEPMDGIVVEKNDVRALAAGLRRLRNDVAEYDPAAIRIRCAQRFSEKTIADRTIRIYTAIAAGDDAWGSAASSSDVVRE
jgi:glycosyltransferase involved in cell wall biosynthesis